MRNRRRSVRAALLGLLLLAPASAQTTWYVDAAAPAPGDGSLAEPFPGIQAGVEAASDGDTISVAPGEYVENVATPDMALFIVSQGGPLVTVLRAAAPGPALDSDAHSSGSTSLLQGFTITQSDIGVQEAGELHLRHCIIRGNGIGQRNFGGFVDRCTITGNGVGIHDGGIGVVLRESIAWGNTTWDLQVNFAFASPHVQDSVGLQKVSAAAPPLYVHVLFADPLLWDAGDDDVHLQPGSPCIGFADGVDVGALDFDPAWGTDFADVGGALAGTAGRPELVASGVMLAGSTVTLHVSDGLPAAPTVLVVGLSELAAPFKGGTLVPQPDLLLGGLQLGGAGSLDLGFAWPDLPSGLVLWCQAWIADPQGPHGFAASNGLRLTPP